MLQLLSEGLQWFCADLHTNCEGLQWMGSILHLVFGIALLTAEGWLKFFEG